MGNKLVFIITTVILFAGIFAIVYAKSSSLLCPKKQNLVVILKNEADINKSKEVILKISHIKIVKIQDRDKEWSKMVNKYDLPKMENPFKNEFTIKIKKSADTDEIYNKIKEMSFVEDVKYSIDKECSGN